MACWGTVSVRMYVPVFDAMTPMTPVPSPWSRSSSSSPHARIAASMQSANRS